MGSLMNKVYGQLLTELNYHPVLLDIGASGGTPQIWHKIAPHSIYVGFDPDLRETREVPQGRFHKATIFNQAVSANPTEGEIPFYQTASPYCSSTLPPDTASLGNYLFADLFRVEKETRLRATTLDAVMEQLDLERLDWFKVDSQGTDLRLFNSLKEEIRWQVLAVDIEPGLINAYQGEDLFVEAHQELTGNGFWLSNLNVMGAVRLRPASLARLNTEGQTLDPDMMGRTVKTSPGWCEARYFRTIEWLHQAGCSRREYILLWIFALLDGQTGFGLDLALEYEALFGADQSLRLMKQETIRRIKQAAPLALVKSVGGRGLGRLQRVWQTGRLSGR